jgi:hypothetical protein
MWNLSQPWWWRPNVQPFGFFLLGVLAIRYRPGPRGQQGEIQCRARQLGPQERRARGRNAPEWIR